jgi:NADH-quinone oxidoreductase subunit N
MNLENFLVMRQELLLILIVVIALISEIFVSENKKTSIICTMLWAFGAVTVIGFLPASTGELFGGMYINSPLTIMMKNILNIAMFIVLLQSSGWLKTDVFEGKIGEYFILIVSSLIGMNFMISSGDFLMFYLGLELATIPLTALAAFDKFKNRSAEAGIKFVLFSALSSGVLLYGLSMIYGSTGSIYFTDVAASFGRSPLQILGFIFFLAGMGFKISMVPFHLWTADVYEGAPINVTSFLSVASKGAAVFLLNIVLFKVFYSIVDVWQTALYVLAVITMTVGNLFAMRQNNMKRFLAFSSISQAGFILVGMLGASQLGMATVVYYILVYVFTNLAAFGVVSIIALKSGKENMEDYNGLYRTNPKLSLTMMLALFSLAGIPPVAGFFGKFFLFTSAASQGYYILVLIAVLNATISLYYYLKVVKAMFIDKSENPIAYFKSDFVTRLSLAICIAGIFAVGFASQIFEYIKTISFGL